MLGDIGTAELLIFLILVWNAVGGAVATIVLYRLRFRKAFVIAASSSLISLVLAAWAYFSIWGYITFQ